MDPNSIRYRQKYLSRHHMIIIYLSRLPNRKIKKLSVSRMYLFPFPSILKPTFPISRLKKIQITRPEKALSGTLENEHLQYQYHIPSPTPQHYMDLCIFMLFNCKIESNQNAHVLNEEMLIVYLFLLST